MKKFIGLLVVLSVIVLSFQTLSARELYTTKPGFIAAKTRVIIEEAYEYIVAGDRAGFIYLYDSGLIILLKSGIEVFIMEVDGNFIKIRPKGELVELWTVLGAVKETDD